jgi:hypothetical protein
MRKSLVVAILLLGAGATRVGADPVLTDVSTWRWQVAAIEAHQRDSGDQRVAMIAATQRYERLSPQGAVETETSTP